MEEGFTRPSPDAADSATRHLYIANCAPGENLKTALSAFGSIEDVRAADASATRSVASFYRTEDAQKARNALHGRKCDALNGLEMVIQYAVPRQKLKLVERTPVSTSVGELGIPGLHLVKEFISVAEEADLLAAVDARPWKVLAKRRVQHYGYEFLYQVRNVDPAQGLGGLPEFVKPLLERLSSQPELVRDPEAKLSFDQLTVNEYPRGVGLSPHIDTHSAFQGPILSLSLAGSCVMEFRRSMGGALQRKALFLPRRSLLILSGEARYAWQHYIPHHKLDYVAGEEVQRSARRVSYTFRKIRVSPCSCSYREFCDSQNDAKGDQEEFVSVDELATPEIEKKFVHKVYDAIAPHFSSTRFAKWPKVAEFLNSLAPGSFVIDAGCGNGKYLGFNKDCEFIGCDISAPLVGICAQRGHEVFVGDALNLPFRDGCFDAAISIAVLHHLSTESRRRRAVLELLRVVSKGGRVLVTVWAAEQEDKSLLKKWTPLSDTMVEEWVGDINRDVRAVKSSSPCSLEKIDEGLEIDRKQQQQQREEQQETEQRQQREQPQEQQQSPQQAQEEQQPRDQQQEYFVPWHLPYHRAEIGGAADAVASGFARKDDKKSAVVYNRFYHVFVEGELERLVSHLDGAEIVDRFYDKSNWCIVLRRT